MHTPEQLRALASALETQRQADEDGVFVAVSRQACDEAVAILRAQADALASPPAAEPAAPQQQPEAAQPAEPSELPPLTAHPAGPPLGHWSPREQRAIFDYARLALATSPLPPERVERVMEAVCKVRDSAEVDDSMQQADSDKTLAALATVRDILEGRA